MPELLELIMAAKFLDIPGLYQHACQSVAASIKGKHPIEICEILQQDCDLDPAQIRKIRKDNPWLSSVVPGAHIENGIYIPNEVLLTICEKLPREDLERLQLVSIQFNNVIVNSVELSEQQGPLRIVTKVEFGAYSDGHFSQSIGLWLRDGTKIRCPDYKSLAKRLKFAVVQKMRAGYGGDSTGIQGLSALLPAKSAWRNATVEASFASSAVFDFVFTELLFCKEIVLDGRGPVWTPARTDLPAIAACNKLDLSRLTYGGGIYPSDVVEWVEQEVPPENKWSEPRQLILREDGFMSNLDELLNALKTAFLAASSPQPYVVRIRREFHRFHVDEELSNDETQEVLSIRAEQDEDLFVKRA